MRKLKYLLVFVVISGVLVIHTIQANDEERQAEEFAEWVEANEDNIASFINKDADYDHKWYLENINNVHKYLDIKE